MGTSSSSDTKKALALPVDPTKWKQGDNSNKKDPLICIAYISRILAFVVEEVFEAVRYSSVSRDWREAVQDYCDNMWYIVCKNIQKEPGFQAVFLKILQSDQLLWCLKCCYRQRETETLLEFLPEEELTLRFNRLLSCKNKNEENNNQDDGDDDERVSSRAMLPIDFLFIKCKPALWVAAKARQPKVVHLLIQLGADVNQTAVGVSFENFKPLEILVSQNVNDAETPEQSSTAMQRTVECIKVFIEDSKAIASFTANNGEYPLESFVHALTIGLDNEDAIFSVILNNEQVMMDRRLVKEETGGLDVLGFVQIRSFYAFSNLLEAATLVRMPKMVRYLLDRVQQQTLDAINLVRAETGITSKQQQQQRKMRQLLFKLYNFVNGFGSFVFVLGDRVACPREGFYHAAQQTWDVIFEYATVVFVKLDQLLLAKCDDDNNPNGNDDDNENINSSSVFTVNFFSRPLIDIPNIINGKGHTLLMSMVKRCENTDISFAAFSQLLKLFATKKTDFKIYDRESGRDTGECYYYVNLPIVTKSMRAVITKIRRGQFSEDGASEVSSDSDDDKDDQVDEELATGEHPQPHLTKGDFMMQHVALRRQRQVMLEREQYLRRKEGSAISAALQIEANTVLSAACLMSVIPASAVKEIIDSAPNGILDVNAQHPITGFTALMFAISSNSLPKVKLLVELGNADLFVSRKEVQWATHRPCLSKVIRKNIESAESRIIDHLSSVDGSFKESSRKDAEYGATIVEVNALDHARKCASMEVLEYLEKKYKEAAGATTLPQRSATAVAFRAPFFVFGAVGIVTAIVLCCLFFVEISDLVFPITLPSYILFN